MTQYDTLDIKLSNSQLNKLESGIYIGAEVTLNLWSHVIGNAKVGTNFRHRLLTNTQVLRLLKGFANNLSANKMKNSIISNRTMGRIFR